MKHDFPSLAWGGVMHHFHVQLVNAYVAFSNSPQAWHRSTLTNAMHFYKLAHDVPHWKRAELVELLMHAPLSDWDGVLLTYSMRGVAA